MPDSGAARASSGFGTGTALLLGQMMLCSFLWAPAFLLMKRIGADISPLGVTALRDVLGSVLMGGWFLVLGTRILPQGREWGDWTVLAILQVLVPNTLTVYALGEISTSLAALIQTATPLVVAVLAPLLFASEKMSPRRAAGILLGFAGVLLLIGPSVREGGEGSLRGTLAMACVPVSYALGNLYVRAIPAAPPVRLAYGQLLFSGFPALAIVLAMSGMPAFAAAPRHGVDLILLSLFATALPLVLFMNLLRTAGPTIGTMVGYLVPLWTILLGALVLGERLGGQEVLGGLVLLAGLLAVSTTRPAAPPG